MSPQQPLPPLLIDPSQAWFWSDEWQSKEREADEELAAGRYRDFDDIESLIEYLNDPNP